MNPQSILLLLLVSMAFLFGETCPLRAAEEAAKKPAPFAVEVTGTGRPMILIPGLSCGGDVWEGTVAHFKDRYQCHVLMLAGFGGRPAQGELSLQHVLDGLSDYIREQKLDRPVIVGHSLGAFLAFWLGSEHPEQTGPIVAVDGVPFYPALRDATATPDQQRPLAEMLRVGIQMQAPAQFAAYNRTMLATMITAPEDLEKVAASSKRSDLKAVAQALYQLMTIDLRAKVAAIRSPVLLLGATANATSAEEKTKAEEAYRAQVATVPRHKVVFAPKARHFIQLDEPAFFFAEAETFLKESP